MLGEYNRSMSVESALEALRLNPRLMRHVARWEHIPARAARHAPFPSALDDRLAAALRGRGVEALYTHQAAAVEAALRGEHVAVVTPAASGKTLCYNLPVLHRLLTDPRARALYLFPTKALAQDQLAELRNLVEHLKSAPSPFDNSVAGITYATYDGDTPSGQRAKVRDAARILLSNPDMLHAGILPQHPRWASFFANLRVVVVDEMHVYRGVFGSHVANVLRRLRRICRFYGSTPQFLLASATIANPDELAGRLVEAQSTIIGPDQDGAPQGEKHLLFYNPPLIDPDLGIRRSSSLESADLAAHFLAHDVQTIVFAQSRLTTELILTYLQEKNGAASTQPAARSAPVIRGYRGGYLPTERRAIEKGLREGQVRGVVATNALELGIDIGRLDAAVLSGYPGSIASARQQLGRAGRRQGASVGVLVAGPTALDQYIVTHPTWLLGRSPEHARLNPDNAIILAGHLTCAAAELPIHAPDLRGLGNLEGLADLLDDLVEAGQLYRSSDRYFWAGEGSPATAISLRSAGAERVMIQASSQNGTEVIGELEREGVPLLLYEGAIYLHEGATYLVEQLDWDGGIAHVRPITVDFYTRPIISEKIDILSTLSAQPQPAAQLPASNIQLPVSSSQLPVSSIQITWGDVRVVSQATGYRIQRQGTNEVLGFGQVTLPEQVLETQACRLTFSEALIETLKAVGQWLSDPNDYGPNWPAQRDAARARDGYRCLGCGQPELQGRQHDVHHKAPFRAFVGDPTRREGLAADQAWRVANRLENLVTLCPTCHRRAEIGVRTRTGLGGAAALLTGVAPLFLMCDPRDLGVVAEPLDPDTGLPTITIYEKTPGGVGYAEQLAASMPELLRAALDTVTTCPCTLGCPACVGPILEHEYALDAKTLAQALLEKAIMLPGNGP